MNSDPVVILPGLMCDGTMFGAQIDAFDAQVIGGFYGQADNFDAMADYALDRMPHRAAVIAHSMGARVALEIWRRQPDRISRLLVANTGVQPVRPNEAEGRYALRDLGRSQGFDALATTWLGRMIGPGQRDNAQLFDTLLGMCRAAGQATFEAQIHALLNRPDCAGLLPTLTCPTHVVAGRQDEWAPPAQHEAIAAQVPRAVLRVMESAGHMAPAEAPEQFNAIASEWLAQ